MANGYYVLGSLDSHCCLVCLFSSLRSWLSDNRENYHLLHCYRALFSTSTYTELLHHIVDDDFHQQRTTTGTCFCVCFMKLRSLLLLQQLASCNWKRNRFQSQVSRPIKGWFGFGYGSFQSLHTTNKGQVTLNVTSQEQWWNIADIISFYLSVKMWNTYLKTNKCKSRFTKNCLK